MTELTEWTAIADENIVAGGGCVFSSYDAVYNSKLRICSIAFTINVSAAKAAGSALCQFNEVTQTRDLPVTLYNTNQAVQIKAHMNSNGQIVLIDAISAVPINVTANIMYRY